MVKYLIVWLMWMSISVSAEVLRDPTMPPFNSGLLPEKVANQTDSVPVLQSVTLGSEIKYAMINGQYIQLGTRYRHLTLVKLTANEAVLKAVDGTTQVLKMDFQIKKTSVEKSAHRDANIKAYSMRKQRQSVNVVMESK